MIIKMRGFKDTKKKKKSRPSRRLQIEFENMTREKLNNL